MTTVYPLDVIVVKGAALPAEHFFRLERYVAAVSTSVALAGIAAIQLLAASELRSVLTGAVLVLLGIALGGLYKLTRALIAVAILAVKFRTRQRAIEAGIDPAEFDRMWDEGIEAK